MARHRGASLLAMVVIAGCGGAASLSPSEPVATRSGQPNASTSATVQPMPSSTPGSTITPGPTVTPPPAVVAWRDCPTDPISAERLLTADRRCFDGLLLWVQGWIGPSPPDVASPSPASPDEPVPTGWSLYADGPTTGCAGQAGCPAIALLARSADVNVRRAGPGWAELEAVFQGESLVVEWIESVSATVRPTVPTCPAAPATLASILHSMFEWRRYEFGGYGVVACYGDRELRLTGWLAPVLYDEPGTPRGPSQIEPAWLGLELGVSLWGAPGSDGQLLLFAEHPEGLDLAPGQWVDVTGHFDDERSATCREVGSEAPDAFRVMNCRTAFVVTSSRAITAPAAPSASANGPRYSE